MASEQIPSSDDTAAGSPATRSASAPAHASGSDSSGSNSSASHSSAGAGASDTPQDPDSLVRDIERTRTDLAETLDAIADRVSPKNVARRSSDQAVAVLKEKAAVAKVVLAEKAAQAKEVFTEKSGTAKTTLTERTASTRVKVAERAGTARAAVADRRARGGSVPLGEQAPGGTGTGTGTGLPPTTGVEVPGLAPVTPIGSSEGSSTYLSASPTVRVEVIGGALAALLGLWLLRRRR